MLEKLKLFLQNAGRKLAAIICSLLGCSLAAGLVNRCLGEKGGEYVLASLCVLSGAWLYPVLKSQFSNLFKVQA